MNWKWTIMLAAALGALQLGAQPAPVSFEPVFTPAAIPSDPKAPIPWDDWFAKNAMVTDKTDYVHFFWNAGDVKAYFETKGKKVRLAQAAFQLVSRLYPAGAKADAVKVDIVYVGARDTYGLPRWETMEKVVHFEFTRSEALKLAGQRKPPAENALPKIFSSVTFY